MGNSLNPTPDAWTLFRSMFKDGDEVVITTDEDEFHWGVLTIGDLGCDVKRPGHKPVYLEWDVIRFMAPDGFPVKKLMGADGHKSIMGLDTRDTRRAIRQAFTFDFCTKCGHRHQNGKGKWCDVCRGTARLRPKRQRDGFVYRFGDPFEVHFNRAVLLNPGNNFATLGWEIDDYTYSWQWEEVLVIDGQALLWDIPTIYVAAEAA